MHAATLSVPRLIRPMLHAGWLLAAGVQAQTPGCEQFKVGLVKRLQADGRGLAVEAVPANEPLPAGAKVVGNCGGGAYKIVLRSGGAVAPAPASSPAPSAAPVAAPAAAPPQRPVVRAEPVASAVPVTAAVVVVSASAPTETAPVVPDTSAAPGSGFMTDYGRWLLVLVLLPIGVWAWRWAAHRRLYDKNGLPRGPRF